MVFLVKCKKDNTDLEAQDRIIVSSLRKARETVSIQTPEEIPGIPTNTEEFLLLHHQDRPDGDHRCLV